jgi:hypothetical protein
MRLSSRTVRNGALYVALAAFAAALLVSWHEAFDRSAMPAPGVMDERFPRDWMGAQTLAARPEQPPPPDYETRAAKYAANVAPDHLQRALNWLESRRGPPARDPSRNWVFSESQIASVKSRLQLTAEQEKHWPMMEAALRDLVWEPGRNGGALNVQSVRRLREVAEYFVTQLSEAQKREVKVLAGVAGLNLNF